MTLTEQARYFAAGLNESARHATISSPLASLLLELAAECERLREAVDGANARADFWTEQAAELNAEVEHLRATLTATEKRAEAWKRVALEQPIREVI